MYTRGLISHCQAYWVRIITLWNLLRPDLLPGNKLQTLLMITHSKLWKFKIVQLVINWTVMQNSLPWGDRKTITKREPEVVIDISAFPVATCCGGENYERYSGSG